MKQVFSLFLCGVLFLNVLPSVFGAESTPSDPNIGQPHYVKCAVCKTHFWSCTESDKHGVGVCDKATSAETLACGHAVGSKGIHLRVSCEFCSEQFYFCDEGLGHGLARCPRNDKGETCTVSGGRMILCADPPHLHKYPSEPRPCPAARWTGCDGTGTAHKRTCLAGHTYYTCNLTAKAAHEAHTASDAAPNPDPLEPGQNPGDSSSQEQKHKDDDSEGSTRQQVACRADAWTSCGGTVSHAATCPAGHTYYTCNLTAKAAHEAHTASDAPPQAPPKQTNNNKDQSGANQNKDGNTNSNKDGDSDSESPNTGGDSSEGVRKCGHPKSASGDHSFVSSCSATNANGDACERTSGYWTCKGHTHKFPEKQPTCPAHGWTDCGGDAGDHDATCAAGHAYYTCNTDAAERHSKHKAAPPSPPPPPPPPQEDSDPDSDDEDDASDSDDDSDDDDDDEADDDAAMCGAHGWTGCGGKAGDHDAVCGKGHSYYTCNASASAYHAKH